MNQNFKAIFYRCNYSFFVSGMTVLVVGAILPLLIADAGLSYSAAGSLLSAMAIGNLLSSFAVPPFYKRFGRKTGILILSLLVPLAFIGLILMPPLTAMVGLMLVLGIGRGSISNFSNSVVGDYSGGTPAALNILHTCFALGAFLSPFLTSILLNRGFKWQQILLILVGFSVTSFISYSTIPIENKLMQEPQTKVDSEAQSKNQKTSYLKSFDFYCIGLILFFYLGMENCVNGWFVTYLQNTGVMSEDFARYLVSITWLCIMFGRILCAWLSKRFSKKLLILLNCFGSFVAFLLLIPSQNIVLITVSIVLLGICLAGIYPTCIAGASSLILGSPSAMAVLMGIAAVGGIVTPKIIGYIADWIGIVAAMSFLLVDVLAMVGFAIVLYRRKTLE